MKYLLCVLFGYLVGTINPSYIIGKMRGLDIRENGSKNAGASNALIMFGKFIGVFCALFDIAKSALVIWMCGSLFPELTYSFSITGISCVLGHVFPFYMKFKGGKGLACLGGMILAFDWRVFLIMLACEILVAVASDYICFVPLSATVIFPVVYGCMRRERWEALILCLLIPLMLWKHKENLKRIRLGTEMRLSFLWNKEKELERLNISQREKEENSK